jgi:hypothetical protein
MTGFHANVCSIPGIVEFRAALCTFDDDALRILAAIEQIAQGALYWLEQEVPQHWKMQVRRCYDEVARTRAALHTCRLRTVGGRHPACIEEQEAFHAARRKLHEAEEKIEVARAWANRIRREIDEYRGRVMQLRLCLECDVPRAIALLDRTLLALEAYVETPVSVEPSAHFPGVGGGQP